MTMMTIVTHVTLREGSGPEWDAAMRSRLAVVKGHAGWVSTQLLIPSDALNKRVIVGTWLSRADWEAWHRDPAFAETGTRLAGLEAAPRQEWWHEVLLDVRATEPGGLHGAVDAARDQLASALAAAAEWLRKSGRGPA